MTAHPQVASVVSDVNRRILAHLDAAVPQLLSACLVGAPLEREVWTIVLKVGRMLLEAALGLACWRVTHRETEGRPVRFRMDRDHQLTRATTLGP